MDVAHQGPDWTEADRLAALNLYQVLDTPREQDFDDLVRMASGLLDAPIAAVSLIDAGRQWFKAEVGLGVREMPLDNAICAELLLSEGELVIPDLLEDRRFACNPLVNAGPGLRFYAGEVLRTAEGLPLGTLCVLDTRPRPQGLTDVQRFALRTLARQVMSQLELRRTVAERDKALAAQRGDATRHRQIVDSPTDFAIVATDLQGRVTRWNSGAENILGWTEDEMLGQTTERFFTPEDRATDRIGVEMRIALESGRANDERWHLHKDNTRFWASGVMTPLRNEAGEPTGFVKVLRDRTEQHAAGAALDALAERHRLVSQATNDAVWDWDQRTNSVSWNEALEAAYGWKSGQVDPTGDWWIAQIHPEDRARIHDAIHAVIDGIGEHWTGEYRFRRSDGRYAEVLDRGYVIRDEKGRPVRMIGAMLDLTRTRMVESALQASEALAQENIQRVQLALAAGAIIGTWNWELPTDRFTVDEASAYTFGLDPALGRVGLGLEQVVATVHPDDKPGLAAAINEVIARGGSFAHRYRVRRADGRFYWIEANGRVNHAPDGKPLNFLGVVLDVEERRAMEAERDRVTAELRALTDTLEQQVMERTAELLRAEEQLRQAQKMEAVGQLTGGIAHDFNNLLTGITGALELLGTRIAQGRFKELDGYVAAADGAAKRAAALTHRLLAFSRQQTLDPRPTDVNRLIAGMEELIRRTIGPSVTLEVVGATGLWPTLVDPNQLENALLNLAINARDAMPRGGRLTVETANTWLDARVARERDMVPGQYVIVSVTDTGTGMPPDVIARAFDPFFTTKPLGQGTGLGLSMIYGFTRQSGGQVRIYSEVGDGTTMRLYLPRHVGEADATEDMPTLARSPRAETGQTVLVVDDEPTIRMLVTEVLENLGYAAVEAGDGASGLGILRSGARIDLLVTDVGLPNGMNGRQMADAARAFRPDLKVLFITGYAENAVVGNGQLEPGMHVMTKPFALEALASRIRELISGPPVQTAAKGAR
ncbi:PAS domain-containing protein [Pseudoroseomonas globiformis]|uniref:histidine kinase n=1 Tax=Teichococcus globiformis TaxID=2307229 RepID=A0ABV7G1K3_9PROT